VCLHFASVARWGEDLEFEMIQSYNSIVSVSRTTISDIMSVSTTEKMEIMLPEAPITKKTKLSATLPYNSAKMRPPVPQPKTDLSKYQTVELKLMKGEEFKEERRQFFRKLEFTRRQKQFLETNASVKIQAIVRGFLIRPRPERIRKIIYPPLKICCSTSNEARILQDELCAYAVHLGLKPITGLSLEARSKHKKRKNEIEYAASLRIQSFFRMIVAILRVRRAGQQARVRLHHQSAVKLQKFLRYVVWMVRRMKKQDESRELAALKIQSHYRRFKSFHRFAPISLLFLLTTHFLFPSLPHLFFSLIVTGSGIY
jgi:hypothetical protein